MSEPSTLYARFTVTPEEHAAFLSAAPVSPTAFADWQDWFDTRRMYGDGRVKPEDLVGDGSPTVGAALQGWADGEWNAMRSDYDEATGRLRIVILQLTENYGEMIAVLAPLRGAARHNDPGADDFVLVYPYLWEPAPHFNAYLTFGGGASRFVETPPAAHKAEADAYISALLEQLGAGAADA